MRKLKKQEQICKSFYEETHMIGTIMCHCQLEGMLNKEIAVNVTHAIQKNHPMLQCRFSDAQKDGYNWFDFEPYQKLSETEKKKSLPIVFLERNSSRLENRNMADDQPGIIRDFGAQNSFGKACSQCNWVDVSTKEENYFFSKNDKYLWRLVVVLGKKHHDLLLFAHHSICDGFSAAYFMKDFAGLCNRKDYLIEQKRNYDYPENVHDQIPIPVAEPSLLNAPEAPDLFADDIGTKLACLDKKFEKWQEISERKSKNIFLKINENTLNQMKSIARQKKIKMTSLLSAILIKAFLKHYLQDDSCKQYKIDALIPINLRPYCHMPVQNNDFGVFVTDTKVSIAVFKAMDLWEVADVFQACLQKNVNKKKAVISPDAYYELNGISKFVADTIDASNNRREFYLNTGVSNLGNIDFTDATGNLKIKSMCFSAWQTLFAPIAIYTLTCNDALYISFQYTTEVFSNKSACNIVNEFCAIIGNEFSSAFFADIVTGYEV